MLKRLLEASLEEEMIERLGASWCGGSADRRGYHNGWYRRDILTEFGLIERLRVPRARGEVEPTKLLEHYRQRQGKVSGLIWEMFLAGVSTRRVGEVLKPVRGREANAQTVPNVALVLDREVTNCLLTS